MNQSELQDKISKTGKPVMVDFWASWCVPCRMTKPILEKLAREYAEKVDFVPINADDSRQNLNQFQVLSIPTVLAFRDGKVVGRVTGAQNEAGYRAMFDALAAGEEIRIPLSAFERIIRLGAGALVIAIGITTSNWFVAGIGGLIAFLGVYDRCPVWAAIMGRLKGK